MEAASVHLAQSNLQLNIVEYGKKRVAIISLRMLKITKLGRTKRS